jgi:hypothetical protein
VRRHPILYLLAAAALSALALGGCLRPEDQRPGFHLSGEVSPLPADWSFTDAQPEIALEVSTPYLLPHSVTIWCATLDGALYVGARNPESKRWPRWVDADPAVRLAIADRIYEATLVPADAPEVVGRLRRAYAEKYELPVDHAAPAPPIRYWRVSERS